MRIGIGTEAPEFEVASQFASRLRLAELRRKRHVGLLFLRYVGCPLCQMDLAELARAYDRLVEREVEPVVFVESPQSSVAKFTARRPLPYHLVGDPERRIYSLYGLEEGGLAQVLSPAVIGKTLKATLKGFMHGRFEGTERRLPGGFVVDPAGRVILAHYGRDLSDSLTVERILSAIPVPAPSS